MKTPTALWAIALIGLSSLLTTVAAGRLTLRPLSPQELRRALTEAGLPDAELAPMGRATPSAFAGLGGYALGLANGLGGALIFDLLTSNETAAYVTNLINSLNTTTTNTGSGNGGTTQEVCFASRSLDGDQQQLGRSSDQYEDVNDDVYDYEDDDADDFSSAAERQVDDYISSDYADAGGNGLTCIVVNRGRAVLRHRRSAGYAENGRTSVKRSSSTLPE
ncbi:uncharacterized protein [Drosophila virilis]|uniref:uncharacterized protein n=1 Tax=Drosophila virilis TaxID=7244 RepID=UPI0038B2A4A3